MTTDDRRRQVAAARPDAQGESDIGSAELASPGGMGLESMRAARGVRGLVIGVVAVGERGGESAANASLDRSHGTSPSRLASWPAEPISTMASVQPSASSRCPIAPDQVVAPVVQTRSPTLARTAVAAASTRSSALVVPSPIAEIRTSTASTRA